MINQKAIRTGVFPREKSILFGMKMNHKMHAGIVAQDRNLFTEDVMEPIF
jgi:hypothetical protein